MQKRFYSYRIVFAGLMLDANLAGNTKISHANIATPIFIKIMPIQLNATGTLVR